MSIKSEQRNDLLGILFWFVVSSAIAGAVGALVVLATWAAVN